MPIRTCKLVCLFTGKKGGGADRQAKLLRLPRIRELLVISEGERNSSEGWL